MTIGKAFALNIANTNLTPGIPYVLTSLSGVIPKCRAGLTPEHHWLCPPPTPPKLDFQKLVIEWDSKIVLANNTFLSRVCWRLKQVSHTIFSLLDGISGLIMLLLFFFFPDMGRFEPLPMILWDNSWVCAQEWTLVVLRGPNGVGDLSQDLSCCRCMQGLPPVVSLQP